MQPYNLRPETLIQKFLILDYEKSRISFNLIHLPNDSGDFIIQFH